MYSRPPLSEVDQEFNDLTKNFDLEDWRTVRNENYWWIEEMSGLKRSRSTYEKLDLIRHYVNKGVSK
tara:strand:+ start:294 stop:494 length:201 start_codon:yes stop_codon:yes gene_type:complete